MSDTLPTIGWIGAGRMGLELAGRLLRAGYDVEVWNRTREKAEPLAALGATIVDRPADLAGRDVVITMVSSSAVYESVVTGEDGVLSVDGVAPGVLVDSSTISVEASERVRRVAEKRDVAVVAAPVSGNPKTVWSGRLAVVASGPREAYDQVADILATFGRSVTYVGDNDRARLVKICHNLLLGVVTQSLAEITVLAERGGISRADFLEFVNGSVMGSTFTAYKTPAFVNLEWKPTFTGHLLRKDFELGLAAAREYDVPLPVASLVHQIVVGMIGSGHGDVDFGYLLEHLAQQSGLTLEPEHRQVPDGLEPVDSLGGPSFGGGA